MEGNETLLVTGRIWMRAPASPATGCPSENQDDKGNFSPWISLPQITARLLVAGSLNEIKRN